MKPATALSFALFGLLSAACEPAGVPTPPSGQTSPVQAEEAVPPGPLRVLGEPYLETSVLTVAGADAFPVLTWYVNGMPVRDAGRELTGRHFDKGDEIHCLAVRYVSGRREERECERIAVANSPPSLDGAYILPGRRLPWDTLAVAPDGWDDADGDLPQWQVSWLVNGAPADVTGESFRSLTLLPGDQVQARVVPFDGETWGTAVDTPPVVISAVERPVEILAFYADAAARVVGRAVRVTWQTDGAESCTLGGEALLPELLAGGDREIVLHEPLEISLICYGSGGMATASTAVAALPPPPSIDLFEARSPVINYGDETELLWSVTEAFGCKLQGVARDGTTATVQPLADTEYSLQCGGAGGEVTATTTVAVRRPRINEVAWMGTTADANDEWIEIYNAATVEIDLDGWRLRAADGTPDIVFEKSMGPGAYWLLERSDDNSVPGVAADLIYTGGLGNGGEALELLDSYGRVVDRIPAGAWPAGDSVTKATMERIASHDGPGAWAASTVVYARGLGSPREANSKLGYPQGGTTLAHLQAWHADHAGATMPSHGPKDMAHGLVAAIDAATASIDFALYGMQGSQEIRAALQRAIARGVGVRGVVDTDSAGWFAYRNTADLMAELPEGAVRADGHEALMHNKFFVFDNKRVWTATANLSDAGINAEYNCNVALLVESEPLAQAYAAELLQMYAGRFHRAKKRQTVSVVPRLPDGTLLEVYFAPHGDARRNALIRAIDAATDSIDAIIYFLTDQAIADALKSAHARGVTVRVVMDASGAAHPSSRHRALRAAGVRVKTEDWGGKAHTKMLLADGYVVVLGSQNWTEAGNRENDENTLYIENAPLYAVLRDHFEADWASIPERWLAADPRAESLDSPGTLSDLIDNDSDGLVDEGAPEKLMHVGESLGSVNAYFSKSVLHAFAAPGNQANGNVDFTARFLHRLNAVTQSVEMTAYELNNPALTAALVAQAAAGVSVRMIVDGKAPPPSDPAAVARYAAMRLQLERLARGADGVPGTSDDVRLLADSPVFAVEDAAARTAAGLPTEPAGLPPVTVWVGSGQVSGRLLADAERKPDGATYYAAGEQMHHKFALFDRRWVWTGSWNPADDGTGRTSTDQIVEFHAPGLAQAFLDEFETMWGGSAAAPDPHRARFHGRKPATQPRTFLIGGRHVELHVAPGGKGLERLRRLAEEAQEGAYFTIFAWSDQALADALKVKWEGSPEPGAGSPTGFRLAGVFDRVFWDQWWSASVDMRGRAAAGSAGNPSVPWAFSPPVVSDGEDRTLHTKVMVFDPEGERPTVVFGSANWGNNGDQVNDDHMLVVVDKPLANQFMQHFWARYFMGGGRLPAGGE